jgi:hypothetical protein
MDIFRPMSRVQGWTVKRQGSCMLKVGAKCKRTRQRPGYKGMAAVGRSCRAGCYRAQIAAKKIGEDRKAWERRREEEEGGSSHDGKDGCPAARLMASHSCRHDG